MERHARQARLVGVGREGQARLSVARADVPLDGLAGDVAARYLAGAGVGRVRVRSAATAEGARAIDRLVTIEVSPSLAAESPDDGPATGLRDPVTQQLARGATCALRALLRAIRDPS
jgi:hypothetical protein